MPRQSIREYDVKRLLSTHLGYVSDVSADYPVLLVDSHSNLRLALQSRPWLLKPDAFFSCVPDVLVPFNALKSHVADKVDAAQLLAFLDRHMGTEAALDVPPFTRGVLTHFTVCPYVEPASPDDVYSLYLESRRQGIGVAFERYKPPESDEGQPTTPRFRLCVPIDGDVRTMNVAETLVVPAGVPEDRVQDVTDYICAVVKFFDALEFAALQLTPLVLLPKVKDKELAEAYHLYNSDPEVPNVMQGEGSSAAASRSVLTSHSGSPSIVPKPLLLSSPSPGLGSPVIQGRHVLMPSPVVRVPVENVLFTNILRSHSPVIATAGSSQSSGIITPPSSPLTHCSSPLPILQQLPPPLLSQQQKLQQQQQQQILQQQILQKPKKNACMVPLHASGALDCFAEYRQAENWRDVEFPQPWGHILYDEERAIDILNQTVPIALQNTGTSSTLQLTILNPAGRVWFIASGAGSAMIYADTVIANGLGHELANYCEYSGHATEDQTYQLCKAVLLQATLDVPGRKKGRVLLVGGCIANYADVSRSLKGFDHAIREFQEQIKNCGMLILVRRAGPNYHAALRTMQLCRAETGLDIRAYGPEVPIASAVAMGVQYIKRFDADHAHESSDDEDDPPLLPSAPPPEGVPPPPPSNAPSESLPSEELGSPGGLEN